MSIDDTLNNLISAIHENTKALKESAYLTSQILSNKAGVQEVPTPKAAPVDKDFLAVQNKLKEVVQYYCDNDFKNDVDGGSGQAMKLAISHMNECTGQTTLDKVKPEEYEGLIKFLDDKMFDYE